MPNIIIEDENEHIRIEKEKQTRREVEEKNILMMREVEEQQRRADEELKKRDEEDKKKRREEQQLRRTGELVPSMRREIQVDPEDQVKYLEYTSTYH